jgi:hypothetical protein
MVAEGLVALVYGLAKASLHRASLEGVALRGMAGDSVQERAEHLRLMSGIAELSLPRSSVSVLGTGAACWKAFDLTLEDLRSHARSSRRVL